MYNTQKLVFDKLVSYMKVVALCKGVSCEFTGTHVIATVEASIGNINHLSKTEN